MSDTGIEFVLLLRAPVARVFAALTEPRHLERWFCDRCESDPRVDGRLVLNWTGPRASGVPFEARWLEVAPPTRAAFRGGHDGYPDRDAGTVTFTLATEGSGTRLEVRHGFPAHDAYASFRREWSEAWPRALARLTGYLSPEQPA